MKPVISKNNGLRLSLGKKNSGADFSGRKTVGRCCIARGESYHDRFLKDGAWQSQKVWFDMYSPETQAQNTAEQPPQAAEPMPEEKQAGKLKGSVHKKGRPAEGDHGTFCDNADHAADIHDPFGTLICNKKGVS